MAVTDQDKLTRIPLNEFNFKNNVPKYGTLNAGVPSGTPSIWKYGSLALNLVKDTVDSKSDKSRLISRPLVSLISATFPSSHVVTGTNSVGYNLRHAHYWKPGGDTLSYYNTSANNGTIKRQSTFTSASLVTSLDTVNDTSPLEQGPINVGGTEFYDGTNQYYVISNGRVRPYYISTAFTATQIADVDCPSGSGTSPYIVAMDGALFVAKNNAIHNCEFGDITNWPGYFISKEQYPEIILALAKHKNSIVAFSERSTEFFFNAGFSGKSPLSRQETYATKIGLIRAVNPAGHPFVSIEDDIFFLGTSHSTSVGLYRLKDFRMQYISNFFIDSIIATGTMWSVSGFKLRGKTYILVHITSDYNSTALSSTGNTNPTLVYCVEEDFWSIWTSRTNSSVGTKSYNANGGAALEYLNPFPVSNYITAGNGTTVQGYHLYSGDLVSLTANTFNSGFTQYDWTSSYPIDYLLRTPAMDFGNKKYKHLKKIYFLNLNINPSSSVSIDTYVFSSLQKDGVSGYPTAINVSTSDEAILTNLGTSRLFTLECQWSGGGLFSLDGLEFHYVEGEQ